MKRYKRMVRPLLLCCSKLCEAAGVSPLDKEEVDSGADAFAAVLYEENALFTGRTMALLWTGGVAVPRVIEAVDKFAEKKKREKAGMIGGVVVPPEPVKQP